jgi:hypothetical protein
MDKIDIVLWILGAGFGLMFALMIVMWNSLNSRIDKLDVRFDKLDEKVTDIDRRICRLEGAFSSKDCCKIADERTLKRVE